MKIGIVGSGNMGRSLGILWAEQGSYATISVNVLPAAEGKHLGGRQSSSLN